MIGVSGIRGVVGDEFTPGMALDFVQAYVAWLKSRGLQRPQVLLARDTRPSGEMMRHAVLAGLLGGGCRIVELGVVTTPTLQLAIPHHGADGAICITASHNPVEWNALKFFQPNGMYLDKEMGQQVVDFYHAKKFVHGSWKEMGTGEEDHDATARHIDRVLQYVDADAIRAKRFKVVLDGCNGAGSLISPQLLEKLGCTVVTINCEPNGLFPHNPEPLNENMVQLAEAVKTHEAAIGFAHDADADRVAVVTDEGEPIGEDYSLVWAVAHVLGHRKRGPVVTNLSTTMAVEAVAAQYDCEVFRTPVGDVNVSSKMREIGAVVGGEGNGGVILPDIQYGRDGIAALALILEQLAHSNQTSAELNRSLPRFHIAKTVVHLTDLPKEKMPAILGWLKSKEKTARVDERDGIKFEWPADGPTDRWAHIRLSGTEPIVRIICEAPTQSEAERIQNSMRQEIEAAAISL